MSKNLTETRPECEDGDYRASQCDRHPIAAQGVSDRGGELSAAMELRRLFPGITDTAPARECARTVGGSLHRCARSGCVPASGATTPARPHRCGGPEPLRSPRSAVSSEPARDSATSERQDKENRTRISTANVWTLPAPHNGPSRRESWFSRGIYRHMLIAKESNTFLIACAGRVQHCRIR
jgi:hypothetical protein